MCLTFALVLLSSCASTSEKAAKALDNGDYTTAITQSLKSLEDGKDVLEAEMYLQDAWKRANSEWNAQIATIEQSTTAVELHKAISLYNKLLAIHKLVQNAGRNDLKPNRDAILEKALLTQKRLADMYFKEASAILAQGGRENARKALVQYGNVKDLIPEYPDLDKIIAETTKLAIVKVTVSFEYDKTNLLTYINYAIPLLEKQLDAIPFVEVIPFSRTKDPREQGADLLVHIAPTILAESKLNQETRPLNSGVRAARNWKVEKISLVTSATCEIKYSVTDMKTGTVLSSGTFNAKDSTDHDFSVTALLSTGEHEDLQLEGMSKRRTVLVNELEPYRSVDELATELMQYEKIQLGNTKPIEGISLMNGIRYIETPEELAKIQDLNGHTFILFDFYKTTRPKDGQTNAMYYNTYYSDISQTAQTGLNDASRDKKLYADVKDWIVKINHYDVTKDFLEDLVIRTVPETLTEKIAPVLK